MHYSLKEEPRKTTEELDRKHERRDGPKKSHSEEIMAIVHNRASGDA